MTTTESLTADDTYGALLERWEDYTAGKTEEQLGITPTALEQVRTPGRHRLLVLDETGQPGNNFKYNGMAWALRRKLADDPSLRRLYIGSAGNAGAALVAAAFHHNSLSGNDRLAAQDLEVVVDTPQSLVPAKRQLLEAPNSSVHAEHPSVEAATAKAMARAAEDERGMFVHAYDDLDAIAGQGMVAKRTLVSLLERGEQGSVDLRRQRIRLLVQRGGGSLLTGFACELRRLQERGDLGENVELHEVRPVESPDKYDGLNVSAPGSYAGSVLDDPRFVHGTVHVNDLDTGRAAHHMALHTGGRRFEPSGLAGVAAFKQLQTTEAEPTVCVAVLSGANYSPEAYAYFRDAPRRNQAKLLGSFASRSLEELQNQGFDPDRHAAWQPTPHFYGRYPASR
ncbi:MAG TPA: pyridoxal-phosphate dependent enzyme [Candidatus Saccharimonadales bacterium]|nr:pyridoxal-phosphate dependent enzyme [Candidatus Saccharimonadales bacterium]